MSTLAQVQDNIATMKDFVPLTQAEQNLCFEVADLINQQTAVPCTACGYCVPGCPESIAIPQYFSLYNEAERENLVEKGWTASFGTYEILNKTHGKASDCIACGRCESMLSLIHIFSGVIDARRIRLLSEKTESSPRFSG